MVMSVRVTLDQKNTGNQVNSEGNGQYAIDVAHYDGQPVGLCSFISATTIASISGYSDWQCSPEGLTVTLPCNGSIPMWRGITDCSETGEVRAIHLRNTAVAGKIVFYWYHVYCCLQ